MSTYTPCRAGGRRGRQGARRRVNARPLTAAWNQRRKQRPAVLARQPARLPPGPVDLNPRTTQLTTFTAPRHPPDVRAVVHAPSSNTQPTYLCRTPVKPQPLKEDRDRTLNKASQPHLVLLFSQHPVSFKTPSHPPPRYNTAPPCAPPPAHSPPAPRSSQTAARTCRCRACPACPASGRC